MTLINKKKLDELLKSSNSPQIELLEDNKESYKIIITGKKDKMKKSTFENKLLDFMTNMNGFVKEQREFNKEIIHRLDNLEKDVTHLKNDVNEIKLRLDAVESLPTIRKEIKELKR